MFTKTYLQAVDDYERGNSKSALAEFKGLDDGNSDSGVVQEFVQKISRSGVRVDAEPAGEVHSVKTEPADLRPLHSSRRPPLAGAIVGGLLGVIILANL